MGYFEAARIVDLRDQAGIGDSRPVRPGSTGPCQSLPSSSFSSAVKPHSYPVVIPVIPCLISLFQGAFQVFQDAQVIQWVDVAGDYQGKLPGKRPLLNRLRMQGRFRVAVLPGNR